MLQLDSLETNLFVEYSWYSLKVIWKGKVNLDKERASTTFRYQCILSQVRTCVLIAFCSYLTFWWGNGVKGPKRSPVLVLNAKGVEIKAKANGSANHLWISKIVELESLCLIKTLLLQNCSLMGEKFRYGKKVEFVAFDQIYSWKISWFAKTSVFYINIGKEFVLWK